MQVEWNQCDGLSLARDRIMRKITVAKLFHTREKVISDNLLTYLGKISTLIKVAYTYVTKQTLY